MLSQIQDWKQLEVDSYLKWLNNQIENALELKKSDRQAFMLQPLPKIVRNNIYSTEQTKRDLAINDVNTHFEMLQRKVETKIGKIISIDKCAFTSNSGIEHYIMTGEKGGIEIEVILAGGYNIQRLHTRWIIKSKENF